MLSAFAQFVAGEIPEAIVSRVFVRFAERRIVENLLDELVDGESLVQNGQPDVNELGSVFADHADTEKLFVGPCEDELEHAGSVTSDVAARIVFVKRSADDVINFLFLAG